MTERILVPEDQAADLAAAVTALLRRFKLEPGLLAGSAYTDLHVNDVGLLSALSQTGEWTVRRLAQTLAAPDSTVSSALDRLEGRSLVARSRSKSDRRVVRLELTSEGRALSDRLRAAQIENSREMLTQLLPQDRSELVRLITTVAQRRP